MTNENNNRSNAKEKKQKKRRNSGLASFSLIIALFDKLAEIIYNAVQNSFIGRAFTSYTPLRKRMSTGIFATIALKSGRVRRFFRRIRRFLANNIDSCLSISIAQRIIHKLCSFPLHFYGNFGLFFGIYTIVVYFIRQLVTYFNPAETSHLYFGIFIAVLSVPLIFSRINLANSIKNSIVGRSIFKETFGFSDESFENKKTNTKSRGNFMLLFGLLAGLSTFFVHPAVILTIIAVFVTILLIATAPEIGVLISIIAIPFLSFSSAPSALLVMLVLITTFFYIIKVIRGKRTFKLEIVDLAVLAFGVLIIISSFYSAGGSKSSLEAAISFILMLGYFLFVNLMRTEKWIKRSVIALVASASITVLIGIFEFVFSGANNNWLDQSFHSIIKLRIVSLFENPNILAMFIVMVFPFLLALVFQSKRKNTKFLTKLLVILFIACIIFTWTRGAWLAIILGTLAFALIKSRKSFRFFGVALLSLPVISMLLPDSIWLRFTSIFNLADTSTSYRIYTWKGTFNAIKETGPFGIGYGDSSFQAVYPTYSYAGIESTPHSHSLILQILICMGVIGAIVFCIAIFLNFQKCLEYIKTNSQDQSSVYVIAAVASTIAALTMGIFDYIWYNQRIFYLFWIVLAIGCAYVRVGNYERERHRENELY